MSDCISSIISLAQHRSLDNILCMQRTSVDTKLQKSHFQKKQLILVVEPDADSCRQVIATLESNGYFNVRTLDNITQVFQILQQFYDQPDYMGLVVVNEKLLDPDTSHKIHQLACSENGIVIPFILLSPNSSSGSSSALSHPQNEYFIHKVSTHLDQYELQLVVDFLLRLKREHLLRKQQNDLLINEMSIKNAIDARLKFLISHDELTGLLNRSSFENQLREASELYKEQKKAGALLFITIDNFNLLNELKGFKVGDQLLIDTIALIRKQIPRGSLFCRISADEFCLFFESTHIRQAENVAEAIKMATETSCFVSGEDHYGAIVSIGISTVHHSGASGNNQQYPCDLILNARQACDLAKASGNRKIHVYNSDDLIVKERRNDFYWVPIIRNALCENHLFLVFQPVVQLVDGHVSHYEVLLRMRGRNGQIITPDKFIPAAERMNLIHAIDIWVIEQAIDFLSTLPAQLSYISLAINLSGTAFQYPDLFQVVRDKLIATQIDGRRITFEITETAAVDNVEKTRDMINKISSLGCNFALDDFGAGFCSFNYLKSFPVDYVKIDGQFIKNLTHDETDQILVKSMVDIASKLGKKTIAEFVESPETAWKLQELGVSLGQGYMFGKPQTHLIERHYIH
jgi:diguanylate cyclase (GGDEF)-like protein